MNNEIMFCVEEAVEGGYTARALEVAIFTQGDTLDDLKRNIRDAVRCHYVEDEAPKIIHLHFVREEAIAL